MHAWTFLTFGLPHSGKSSFGERLRSAYGFVHLNLGETLRRIARESNSVSERRMVSDSMKKGLMLERNYINALIEGALGDDVHKPIVFDGFPRYEAARLDFYAFLKKFNRDSQRVILLNFVIDVDRSISLQKKRNPNATRVSVNNRVEHYLTEEYEVFRKMRNEHRHFNLYWTNGFENNFNLVTSSINL